MVQHTERSSGNDSVAPAARGVDKVEPNFDRLEGFKSYDSIVNKGSGAGTQVASLDSGASFPSHADYSFYNSNAFGTAVGSDSGVKGANGTGVGTDSSVKGANGTGVGSDSGVKGDNPQDPQFAPPNYYKDFKEDASKFAYGTALTDGQAAEGKDKLQRLTEEMYRKGGKDGLKVLAGDMSQDAEDQFGKSAFKQAGPGFENDSARVKATTNADGSTQVQWNFAQPNSTESKAVIFQIPKTEPSTGGYQEVFPDNKPTWKF